jgi:hypothetical protein
MDAVEFLFSLAHIDERFSYLGRLLRWLILADGDFDGWWSFLILYDGVYGELGSIFDNETRRRLEEIRERVAGAVAKAWLLYETRGEVEADV